MKDTSIELFLDFRVEAVDCSSKCTFPLIFFFFFFRTYQGSIKISLDSLGIGNSCS